jgi:hypothetical protein
VKVATIESKARLHLTGTTVLATRITKSSLKQNKAFLHVDLGGTIRSNLSRIPPNPFDMSLFFGLLQKYLIKADGFQSNQEASVDWFIHSMFFLHL